MHNFINFLLFNCGMVDLMKSKRMEFPKFYKHIFKNKDHFNLTYFSNRYDQNGNLSIEQETILLDSSIDPIQFIRDLNFIEYKKLEIFIKRQEKVVAIYKRQNKIEQYNVVNESLEQFYILKEKFNNWFERR